MVIYSLHLSFDIYPFNYRWYCDPPNRTHDPKEITIVAKRSILDVSQGTEYAFEAPQATLEQEAKLVKKIKKASLDLSLVTL